VMITGARNAFMAGLAPFVPRRTLLGLVRYLQTS